MRRPLLALAMICLVCLSVYWVLTGMQSERNDVTPVRPPPIHSEDEPEFAGLETDAPVPSRALTSASLPAIDVENVATLVTNYYETARQGDTAVACRLARELLRCRDAAVWDEGATGRRADEFGKSLTSEADIARMASDLATAHEYNVGVKQRCKGLTPEQFRLLPRLHYLAATRGHVPSMLDFGDGTGVATEDLVADPELYHAYRSQAWSMFQRAFDAGEPRAATAWAWALQSHGRLLGGVMPAEWRTPGVARALLERMRGELPVERRYLIVQPAMGEDSRPTEAERARAEDLFQSKFAQSPWFLRLKNRAPSPATRRLELDEESCNGR